MSTVLSFDAAPAAQETADPRFLMARGVEKVYPNGTLALQRLNLDIARGEIVSLLGPSGCGKSTLLKMFAALEGPTAGQVRWNGKAEMAAECRMAMVFQEATLMPWATVEENVRLPLSLRGISKKASAPQVMQALLAVGLENFLHAMPRELSGGMQMRVSLARALVTEPDLLLMDEPFGALDEFTRHKLDSDIRKLWAKRGLTVVFVTHSIYEAVYLSSRVIVMGARPGRVVADVAIDGPQERDKGFRTSEAFIRQCAALSALLEKASAGADHD
ncbi:MAG TPA: ABC transporter ATP-binding protein [Franconibacter helveticus]|uniref:ABC transporter ATP-binding protein n=1 Tax=Franconibacter helveticus TaxID=357240 RepID=UPI00041740AB|nr:ABC transporter ATP-binding protein [Franconibacter helveticus]MDU6924165.1 ABC transporter ATP-binding protein [Franconibacter helveticus]HAZ55435.1 ABC transporter ATP-binding protein [Franconibacter helveticus]